MIEGTLSLPIPLTCERFRAVVEYRLKGIPERRARMAS